MSRTRTTAAMSQADAGPATPAAPPMPMQLAALLAQAQWLCTAALMRLVQRGAVAWAEVGRTAAQPGAGEPASAQAVDAARLHLRRLREMALDEARALDSQLLALDEALRALAEVPPAAAEPNPPRRRARAKP